MSSSHAKRVQEKLGLSVRSALNEQLLKLQVKHTSELELLDDLRTFVKHRANIEKECSQNLQRLCQQFVAKRDVKPPPALPHYSRQENRGIMEAWRLLLSKTEEIARQRGSIADMLLNKISDDLKTQRRTKEQLFKRHYEICQRMVSEVLDSVKELTSSKKVYSDRQKFCEDARQKFHEADSRMKSSHLKLFETKSSLEKTYKKASERLKSGQRHAVVARNEYLLCLATANKHLQKHFETDLPSVMKALDGDMYDVVREAYIMYAQLEMDFAKSMRAEFEDLRDQGSMVNRDYVVQCFLAEQPILCEKILYKFEPEAGDKVQKISKDHGADLYLNKEARKWAQLLKKQHELVAEKNKSVKGLQSVTQAYQTTPEFGTADAQNEALQSLSQLQEELRQIETTTTKANTRLDLLRNAGVDVDKWLQQAVTKDLDRKHSSSNQHQQSPGPDLLDLNTSLRSSSLSSSQLSLGPSPDQEGYPATTSTCSSGVDSLADALSIGSSFSENTCTPKLCVAIYHYQAQRTDELDITTDEELEVLEWDDGDGWCRGRKKNGREGFFPQNYVQPSSRTSSPQEKQQTQPVTFQTPLIAIPKPTPTPTEQNVVMLEALYEYTAQDSEELSFPEGAKIRLVRIDENDVDDGWWEGSYNGRVGVFPSVVVEVVSGDLSQFKQAGSGVSSNQLTPVAQDAMFFIPPSYEPPPPPPPPNYPAPEISTADLSIGPNLRTIPSSYNADILSGMTCSSAPTGGATEFMSSSPIRRSSAVVNSNSSPHRLCNKQSTLKKHESFTPSGELADSFEDTFEQTVQPGQWSSFDDMDEDQSYV